MAKAINWPRAFRDEIIGEDALSERIALRLGSLYYENRYWVPDEVVDIRCDHKKIRKATVVGDLRQMPVGAFSDAEFARLKSSLKTPQAVIDFLAATYNQPVDAQTPVTVVTYRNHPLVPDEVEAQDDPHM